MSFKKPLIVTIAGTALLISASSAFAFGQEGHGGGMGGPFGRHAGKNIFKKLDLNKDGVITRQEAEQARADRFTKMDADGDGTVTVAEIDQAIEKKMRRMKVRLRYKLLSKLDSDGDGQITKQEFDSKPMRLFDRADKNGDGEVTKQEARQMMKRGRHFMKRMMMMRHKRQGMGQGGMGQGGMGHQGMGPRGMGPNGNGEMMKPQGQN